MPHDLRFDRAEQIRRFGFCWDDYGGFGDYHDWWSFAETAVHGAPDSATIVEVGSYKGRSICCMGAFAKESRKQLQLFAVDNNCAQANVDLRANLSSAGFGSLVSVVEQNSGGAAKGFRDSSCWLVILDDDHTHEAVEAGIRAWMPKIQPGGWLAGHDFLWHSVAEPVVALLADVIYDERWPDVWIAPKQPIRDGVDIHARMSILEIPKREWQPCV